MAKEKISDQDKRIIADMQLKGKNIDLLANILKVSSSTVRKANREGNFLNKIDELERMNRQKDVQISLLSNSKKKSKSKFFNQKY